MEETQVPYRDVTVISPPAYEDSPLKLGLMGVQEIKNLSNLQGPSSPTPCHIFYLPKVIQRT
jgi:hypothetical protein